MKDPLLPDVEECLDRLSWLNAQRFTTEEVCGALQIDKRSITNYTGKTDLFLCSESKQGSSRLFPLIDIYNIGLLVELSRENGAPYLVSSGINLLFFARMPRENMKEEDEFRSSICPNICHDIFKAPEYYTHRDLNAPIMASFNTNLSIIENDLNEIWDLYTRTASLIVNITFLFARIDIKLKEIRTFSPPRRPVVGERAKARLRKQEDNK